MDPYPSFYPNKSRRVTVGTHFAGFLFAHCKTIDNENKTENLSPLQFLLLYKPQYINHPHLEPSPVLSGFPLSFIPNTSFVSFAVFFVFLVSTLLIPVYVQELANPLEKNLEESEKKNQRVVLVLYDALSSRDVGTVHQILAPDLEWWFHGPPSHQFLMHLLTGASSASDDNSFKFIPLSVTSFGSIVIAEGCDHSRQISWVHAWTVTDGIITQVREYFNTSLTVTRLGYSTSQSESKQSPPSDFPSKVDINPVHCPFVWESSFSNHVGKSVPGLVLAI